jgi:hypothetical protein
MSGSSDGGRTGAYSRFRVVSTTLIYASSSAHQRLQGLLVMQVRLQGRGLSLLARLPITDQRCSPARRDTCAYTDCVTVLRAGCPTPTLNNARRMNVVVSVKY